MKLINLTINDTKENVLSFISDSKKVNDAIRFDGRKGKPFMHVKEKSGKVKITCEMIGGPSKDNGFFVGTFFKGRLTEKDGNTRLKGIILTEPIYHIIWFLALAVMIWQSFYNVAVSVLPILFVAFEIIMFSNEFKKQGYISRYLVRAFSRLERENLNKYNKQNRNFH